MIPKPIWAHEAVVVVDCAETSGEEARVVLPVPPRHLERLGHGCGSRKLKVGLDRANHDAGAKTDPGVFRRGKQTPGIRGLQDATRSEHGEEEEKPHEVIPSTSHNLLII